MQRTGMNAHVMIHEPVCWTILFGLREQEFVCCAFSAENKFLLTQGGAPDWTLVLWSWDKARPHGAVKVSNVTGSVVHECSFNPQECAGITICDHISFS
eukprot:5013810-Amphidinium_carterae.1